MNELVDLFCNWDLSSLSQYSSLISTKDETEIFPPYIPFIGKNYHKYGIFIYCMAQNIRNDSGYLEQWTKIEKIKRLSNSIDIAPRKLMYALVGLYLYTKHKVAIETFDEIKEYIAITNYYKFSLNKGKKDINPNSKLHNLDVYWKLNDDLSLKELEFLKPKVIISFRGRHIDAIKSAGFTNLFIVNDPSWILHGGSPCLKESGSWYREPKDTTVEDLITKYISQINDGKYSKKKHAIEIYLRKYYYDWSQKLG